MIGRLKDKMETSVIPPNPFFAKVKKLKAVLILNRVYSGIDVKKAARKLLILSMVRRRDTNQRYNSLFYIIKIIKQSKYTHKKHHILQRSKNNLAV